MQIHGAALLLSATYLRSDVASTFLYLHNSFITECSPNFQHGKEIANFACIVFSNAHLNLNCRCFPFL